MMKKRPFPPQVPLPKAPPPKKAAPPKPPPAARKGPVSSVREIFAAFFRLCKRRLLPVLAATLLSAAAGLILLAGMGWGMMTALGGELAQAQRFFLNGKAQKILADPSLLAGNLPLLGSTAALLVAAFLLWSWVHTTMLAAAVDEQHGIMEALCTGWKNLFPMLWVSLLFSGLVISWSALVFLLLPAVGAALALGSSPAFTFNLQDLGLAGGSILLLAGSVIGMLLITLLVISVPLSMSFACIILIDEGRGGMDALLVSRLYVRGCWWNTFFKLFLFGIILSILFLPLSLLNLFALFPGQQAVLQLISFLTMPLPLLYMVTVYRDLKQASGKVSPGSASRCLWMPMALTGILLPLLGLLGLALTGGPKKMEDLVSRAVGGRPPAPSAVQATAEPPAPEVRTLPSVDGFVIWRDPVGDTGNPLLDIREVTAVGQDGELRLVITLAQPFASYFAAAEPDSFAPAVKFYFDVDRNPATGAAADGGAELGGYDLELDVLLLAEQGGGRVYPSLYALTGASRQSLAPLEDRVAVIDGSTLTLRLPYSRVDGTSGGRFRIRFLEAAQREGGLSREQTVPLR